MVEGDVGGKTIGIEVALYVFMLLKLKKASHIPPTHYSQQFALYIYFLLLLFQLIHSI